MKLFTFLLISSLFLAIRADFDENESGSGLDPISRGENVQTTEEPNFYTAKVGQFVVVDEDDKRRLCTCAESRRCSFTNFDNLTRDSCANQCQEHLVEIDSNMTGLTECFNEGLVKEMEIGDSCIRGSFQNLCSNSLTDKKASTENWGLNSLQFDTPLNPLHSSNVFMQKASNVYSSLRKFQRCFNNCYRQKENTCREQLRCVVNYPSENQIEETLNECPELREAAFNNARIACKCMIYKKQIVKLIGLCTLFSDQFMNRV